MFPKGIKKTLTLTADNYKTIVKAVQKVYDNTDPQNSFEYQQINGGCIKSGNMQKHENMTTDECQAICNQTPGCEAIEVFKDHGSKTSALKPGDCVT